MRSKMILLAVVTLAFLAGALAIQRAQADTINGKLMVVSRSADGGQPAIQPAIWRYDSTTCLIVSVNSSGPDAGALLAPDGGIPELGVLYRCINPSASAGDVCYLEGGTYPLTCTTPRPMVRIVPGGEITTTLVAPVLAVSSSGAAGMTCCPIRFP